MVHEIGLAGYNVDVTYGRTMRFENRRSAGRMLAAELDTYRERQDVIVLGLPRGGVPVAYEVAAALDAPLDVFLVRKLGVPGREELAMGAVASGGVRVLNRDIVETLSISERDLERVTTRERRELERREHVYRGDRPPPDLADKVVILVDDGLATGASMRAALAALDELGPARTVVTVPCGPPDVCARLEEEADEVVCLLTPEPFFGVGAWYEDFGQTSDDEVRELLHSRSSSPSS